MECLPTRAPFERSEPKAETTNPPGANPVTPTLRRNESSESVAPKASVNRKTRETLAEIKDYRAQFNESVIAARAVGSSFPETLISSVLAKFDELEAEVATTTSKTERDALLDEAAALANLRAYVTPPAEIEIEGLRALSTMAEWSIPTEALEALRRDIVPKLVCSDVSNPSSIESARGALHAIFEEFDSWSDYIDDYNKHMQWVAYALSGLIVISLTGALLSLSRGFVLFGLVCGGACGAFVSVIAKLPTLSVTGGDYDPYVRGIWRRVCTGLAAIVVGTRFVVSGTVTSSFPHVGSLTDVIDACSRVGMPSGSSSTDTSTLSVAPAAKGLNEGSCGTRNILVLVAIVMLFGLSERALTTFEERIFPKKE